MPQTKEHFDIARLLGLVLGRVVETALVDAAQENARIAIDAPVQLGIQHEDELAGRAVPAIPEV